MIKITTYNFCKGGPNFDATHMVLRELSIPDNHPADIVFAQELLNPNLYEDKGKATWRNAGYQDPYWRKAPTDLLQGEQSDILRWGSAIFVKEGKLEPIEIPKKLEGWVVGARWYASLLDNPFGSSINVFCVHTATLQKSNYYPWQAQEVCECLAQVIGDENAIVAGDFNITISAPSDIEQTKDDALFQPIRDYIRRTLNLINCWQFVNANQPLKPTHSSSHHIDAIFVSAPLARYLHACEIRDPWILGDHKPVVATFSNDLPRFKERKWLEGTYFAR
jgi:endonuclease/exonuclease/phosphatase family metal-dependent hydrolase